MTALACTTRTLALLRTQAAFRARGSLRQSIAGREHACSCGSMSHMLAAPWTESFCTAAPRQRLQRRHRSSRCSTLAAAASDTATAPADAAAPSQRAAAPATAQLQLYNSMSRAKEPFTPRQGQGNAVSMYVCGVTVYSMSHIGHARAYVAFDVLYRYLRQLGYEVQYVRNFTDVDDKIIKRAAELGEDPAELSQRYVDEFHEDMRRLGCLPPALEPRATDHIPAMVDTIARILDNGHGYVADGGDVFFDINTLPGYGRLSRHTPQEDGVAEHRVDVDTRKRSPADFALWKAAKPGEPSWDSPWGAGRPGWHIECSAMIRQLMGPVIDIHGGGRDLQFPHHENELAQSRAAACGCGGDHTHHSGGDQHSGASEADFVRYWVHNGFVNVKAEKMSKSLGNFFTIREATAVYAPLALRFWLLGTHYRAAVNYTQRALEEASERLYSIYQALLDTRQALADAGEEGAAAQRQAQQEAAERSGAGGAVLAAVHASMADDLNTAQAIGHLSAPVTRANDLLYTKKGRKQQDRLPLLAGLTHAVAESLALLGLPADDPPAVLQDLRAMALKRAGLTEEDVAQRIEDRATARKAKDFEEADTVRQRLADVGIMIMDSATGTTWRPGVQQTDA